MSADLPPLLIPDTEAARMAGISRSTLHALRAAGKWGPRAIRLGRALRFSRQEVESWIAGGCPPSADWQAIQASAGRRMRVS
jgi:excisionase family DNA binding protein